MEESGKNILKIISNNFSQINTDNFLFQIQNATQLNECVDYSVKFCEVVNSTKNNLYLELSDKLDKFFKNKKDLDNNVLSISNNINTLFNNLKAVVSQCKSKIKALQTNINELYSTANLINSNIEKKKYALASSRIDKVFQIKNAMSLNIKALDGYQQKILDELKHEKTNKTKTPFSSSIIKVNTINNTNNFPSTPSLSAFSPCRTEKDTTSTQAPPSVIPLKKNPSYFSSINNSNRKITNKRNRDLSISSVNRSTSINSLKDSSGISNIPKKSIKTAENTKEIEDLKKKLLTQKGVIDKLKREIEILKNNINNINRNKLSSSGNNFYMNNTNNNLKSLSTNIHKSLFSFNDKLTKTSDLLFSLTFSFNSIQNKYNNISGEEEFKDIKQKLLKMTTIISELKSGILKISIENQELAQNTSNNNMNPINNMSSINTTHSSNSVFSQILEPDTDSPSTSQMDVLKKENNSIQSSINTLKSQNTNLKQQLVSEQKNKEHLENNLNILKAKNDELMEKVRKMGTMNNNINNCRIQQSHTHSQSMYLNKDDVPNILSLKNNSEISLLKETLRKKEKELLELRGIYDSNMESKNLIEKLLKKELEEMKTSNDQKINKFKKKLEDKDKEINKIKERYNQEEMNILNKIKQDNKDNIDKLKALYESQLQNNGYNQEEIKNLEEKYKEKIELLNNELSKLKAQHENIKHEISLENSINLSLLSTKDPSYEEEYKKQIEFLKAEKLALDTNIKSLQEKNEEQITSARENNTKNLNQILSLKEEILKYKLNDNKLNEQILNLQKDNSKLKNDINEYEKEINNLKNNNNELLTEINNNKNNNNNEINKLKDENNENLNEIQTLKNNITDLNTQKNNLESQLTKIKNELFDSQKKSNTSTEEINKLNVELEIYKDAKSKLDNQIKEISTKLSKKDKEIITLMSINTKDKKSEAEKYAAQIEKLKKEVQDRHQKNQEFQSEILSLQKKIFEIENNNSKTEQPNNIKEYSTVSESTFDLISNIKSLEEYITKNEIHFSLINTKNQFINKNNLNKINEEDDEEEEEEDEDEEDFKKDELTEEEFEDKMRKLNRCKKNDSEIMKNYKKENIKMLHRYLDSLDKADEFKQKMMEIEKIITKREKELYSSLQNVFRLLVSDVTINNNNKNNFIIFMRLMKFTDKEINNIFNYSKKKNQFGFFG